MINLDSLKEIFQGLTSLFEVSPQLALARVGLIALGFVLIFLGRKCVLEALIMIPMGLGMATVNAAVIFFDPLKLHGGVGTLFVEPQAGATADGIRNAADLMMILPFLVLLACIALGPLVNGDAWGRHYTKVAFGLGVVTLGYYLICLRAGSHVLSVAHEYVSFIILIGSLFVVSGGIHLTVKGDATPWENVRFLLIGGLAANLLGTTGASMLLIRPWIRMNKYRVSPYHIVFFIFVVSNVGGCLTPIGDPPLFLGYLKGVPFWWVVEHGWPMWLTGMGLLLTAFVIVDTIYYRIVPKMVRTMADPPDSYYFNGTHNVWFLGMILGAVFVNHPVFLREGLMLAAAAGSWFTTGRAIHESNEFNFHPIKEVAILFAGIFATMMPALDWLQANAGASAQKLGGFAPDMFYWGSGALSSVLDNAPTYLSFLSAASGDAINDPAKITTLTADPTFGGLLLAISIGSVFFGANTYIGNGPNFMVKSIADQQKVQTPTFTGYILKFTLPVMLHTHDTAGLGAAAYLAAIEAGVDTVETSISPFANGTSQPDTVRMLALLEGNPRRPDYDPALLQQLRLHFEEVYQQLSKFTSPANERVDSDILVFQVPGGMLSNFRNQLAEQGMADKFNEVVREIPVVREALGWIPLVTPTSQIVGTQAMMNVMLGRWKMICQPAQDIALGKYGKAPGPIHPEILAMAEKQSGTMAVTVRPADLLKPGLEDYRRQCAAKGLPVDDETAVLFAMFPQQVEALVKGPPPAPPVARNSSPAPVTRVSLAAPNGGPLRTMVLNIDGKRHEVSVQKMDA